MPTQKNSNLPIVTFVKTPSTPLDDGPLFKNTYLEKDVGPFPSEFSPAVRGYQWNKMLAELTRDVPRTNRIVSETSQLLEAGKSVLVVADRMKLARNIYEELLRRGRSLEYLHGKVARKKREQTVKDVQEGKVNCLVVTPVIDAVPEMVLSIETGRSCFDALVFTNPTNIKFKRRVGRLYPPKDDSVRPVIRYYVDEDFPQAKGCFVSHLKTAQKLGWEVEIEEGTKDIDKGSKP